MKTLLLSLLASAVLPLFASPVKVILDTDMITDFDDVGALACLHALADAGECEILATVSCTRGNASTAAIGVINGYYGRAELPVGCAKGMGVIGAYAGAKEKGLHLRITEKVNKLEVAKVIDELICRPPAK